MNLSLAVTGAFGHAEAEFAGDQIVITYKKTTDKERGTIAMLVEKAKKKGMKLSVPKQGAISKIVEKAKDVVGIEKAEEKDAKKDDLTEALMAKKGKITLSGTKQAVEQLALETIEEEVKSNRVVSEAQEDGTWKVIKIGEFKAKEGDKKQAVTSHAPVLGG